MSSDLGRQRAGVPTAVPGVGLALVVTTIFMTVLGRQLRAPQPQISRGGGGGAESSSIV